MNSYESKLENPFLIYHIFKTLYYRTKPFPHIINPFPIIGYDEKELYSVIKKLGWERPKDVDPNSSNCRLNSLGIKKHLEIHNFHPYDYEMSMLVRMNVIDRNTAMERVEGQNSKVPG
ncbi:MAG: hypothetical protein PVI26_10315 [Chitinispirillia bacterium]|jgi:hypothetical protein